MEAKRDHKRFVQYKDAITDGLAKLQKYYSRLDRKPCYLLVLALYPYFKLAYIEMTWGGAEEQVAERDAGDPWAKNWQDKAQQVLESAVSNPYLIFMFNVF
jgi:hypothetical protein